MVLLHKMYGWLIILISIATIGYLILMSFLDPQPLYAWVIFIILSLLMYLIGRLYIKLGTTARNNKFTNISVVMGLASVLILVLVNGTAGFFEEVYKITLFPENYFVYLILPSLCVICIAVSLIFFIAGWILSKRTGNKI